MQTLHAVAHPVVGGIDHQGAGLRGLLHLRVQLRHAVLVDGGVGLVEHPHRFALQPQPRQSNAPFLPRGQMRRRHILKAPQPHRRQGRHGVAGLITKGAGVAQVFQRIELFANTGLMPQIKEVLLPLGLPPASLTLKEAMQPHQNPQQGGLAGAVGTGNLPDFPGAGGQAQATEQHAIVALAAQLHKLQSGG